MVASTATSVGLALANDRRLTPVAVFPGAAPAGIRYRHDPVVALRTIIREKVARRLSAAILIGVAAIAVAATVPAFTALASNFAAGPGATSVAGPPMELRAAAGIDSNWEESVRMSAPAAGDLGTALLAGKIAQAKTELEQTLFAIDALEKAKVAAAEERAAPYAAEEARATAAAPPSYSLNGESGMAAGTVIGGARITIYGCQGPGGGFCHHMSGGGAPFAGAAACSTNLPLGTRLTIAGDPTGRVYECLDRGHLPATWIDVFFYDTEDGFAWASELGSTRADITIVN